MSDERHERGRIRDAVVAALVACQTDCGERVYRTRVQPALLDALPAIAVYALHETVAREESNVCADADNPGMLKRELRLAIEIVSSGDSGEEIIDRVCLQVERAMDADATIGKQASDCMLDATEMAVLDNGEQEVSAARLTYLVTYYTKTRTAAATAGVAISEVLGSWAPEIGKAHVDDYVDITDTGVPPMDGQA